MSLLVFLLAPLTDLLLRRAVHVQILFLTDRGGRMPGGSCSFLLLLLFQLLRLHLGLLSVQYDREVFGHAWQTLPLTFLLVQIMLLGFLKLNGRIISQWNSFAFARGFYAPTSVLA